MKKIILILMMSLPLIGFSQELTLNLSTGKYEYVEVVEEARDIATIQKRLQELNYKNIGSTANSAKGQSMINEQVMGFVVEISYDATIEIKDSKYRLQISNIQVKDKMGTYILEDMGGYKKKWLKKTNERLPEIVLKLKSKSTSKDW